MRTVEVRKESGDRKNRKKKCVRDRAFAWLLVALIVGVLAALGVKLFLSMGYRHLKDSAVYTTPQLPGDMGSNVAEPDSQASPGISAPGFDGNNGSDSTSDNRPVTGAAGEADREQSGGSLGGESSESAGNGSPAPDNPGRGDEPALKEGWVRREGKVYEYIDGILTFLVLGIDIDGPVEKSADLVSGGQSDAIFLVVMNPDTKRISLIGVNRDTMVDVVMVGLGANGENLTTKAEIAVQHGFGDGLGQSCELTRDAVSKLFYNLPIHGYISFNMGGMAALNDAVGSVRLTVLEDMTEINPGWYQGADVTLTGKDAYEYIHYRNVNVYESARNRLARQKQYLSVFVGTALAEIKKDVTLPVNLYQAFKPYTVTDLSIDKISYLASQIAGYKFDGNAIYTMEGTTVKGARFEEFYPDQNALQNLIIKVFYREIDPETGKAVR